MKENIAPAIESGSEGYNEYSEDGFTVLRRRSGNTYRRVLFVNCYGGASLLRRIKADLLPPHHLWGCRELARLGYEVALAEPLPDFYLYRNPLPHDLKLLDRVRTWLGPDGIVYCGHNVLYWVPLLKALGAVRSRIVSLLYAREPLDFARAHSGIIALNPAAAEHARRLAPKAKVAPLAWGVDLPTYPRLPYQPKWFFSCGKTHRDDRTLSQAAARCQLPVRLLDHKPERSIKWSGNVELLSGSETWEGRMTSSRLTREQYAYSTASLITLESDPAEKTACGFTNLIESMAMARPIIATRTGAVPSEIDVERAGCGLFVPPNDAGALAEAMRLLANDPLRAREMGETGRRLCETRYNIERYARELHAFFESL